MPQPRKKAAPKPKPLAKHQLSEERIAEIRASVNEPNDPEYGPACHCGLAWVEKEPCPRHN
jgi:hypothetical protein